LVVKDKRVPLIAAQAVMTDMLEVIDGVCKENNINYWLSDGSLLGSIRHQGFIPWDDDADIGMLREDYERFIKIIGDKLPVPYHVQSKEHQTHGLHNWCKIMYMEDFEWEDWHGNWTKGLSVDVFPFDYVQGRKKTRIEKIVNRIAAIRYPLEGDTPKKIGQRIINKLKVHKRYLRFVRKSDLITYGLETPYYGWEYFSISEIFPLKRGKFEGKEFLIPNNPDQYLTKLYGDYMKIPEEENQIVHMSNLRFSKTEEDSKK
jgi:lipopolysaccharide cholinephosphotransferase